VIESKGVNMNRLSDNTEMMTIRVPKTFAENLHKLKSDEELPTIAAALKFKLEHMEKDALEKKIDHTIKQIKELRGRLLYLQGHILVHQVLERIARIHPYVKFGDPLKLEPHTLSHLRQAKGDLEESGFTWGGPYEIACAYLYIYGDEKEDKSPKMYESYKEYCEYLKEKSLTEEKECVKNDQKRIPQKAMKASVEHVK